MNKCIAENCTVTARGDVRCSRHRIYYRECRNCGKPFETKNRKAHCCSAACGTEEWKKSLPPADCPTCGNTFQTTGTGQIYCSVECRPAPEATERTIECIQCGATFTTLTVRKTCSDECATERQDEHSQWQWSDLRRGYETNNADLFFTALISDCDTTGHTDCWEWGRARNKQGYPLARFGRRNVLLHRASLELSEGRPLGVLHAHHKCANTACVNPNHLEPATAADNALEMLARNSYMARIAELEAALAGVAPGHEALNRVPTNPVPRV